MSRWMLVGIALVGSAACALAQEDWMNDFPSLPGAPARAAGEAEGLTHEIGILNLINGLHLTRDQSRRLLALAREVRDLRAETLAEHEAEVAAFRDALAELRETLRTTDAQIPPRCGEKVVAAENAMKGIKHAYEERLRGLDRDLGRVLSPEQIEVVREFNPCIIPPKNLKDPVRAGQSAGDHADVEMHVEHLRNMPTKAYEAIVGPLLGKMIEEWQPSLRLSSEEQVAERARLRALLDRARSITDAEFAMERPAIAKEVLARFTDLQEEFAEVTSFFARFGGLSKAGHWLLNPRVVAILEHRLAQGAEAVPGKARGDADSCEEDGDCGKHGETDPAAGRCPCGKPTFEWLRREVSIPDGASERVREAIARGQVEMLNLLAVPRSDGSVPLLEMFTCPETLMEALSEPAPGGGTYISRIEVVKARMLRAIERDAEPAAFRRFQASGVDLFDLHVGNLQRWE